MRAFATLTGVHFTFAPVWKQSRLMKFLSVRCVKAEMFAGALNSQEPERTLEKQRSFFADFETLYFDDKAAEAYAPIRASLKRTGRMIGTNDLLIAAIALANNLILVTHNTDEFQRVPGLIIEDWEVPIP